MKRNGIRKTLFLSHVSVALISLIIITLLVNTAVYFSFGRYIRIQQKAEAEEIVREIDSSFTQNQDWDIAILMSVSHRAMLGDFVLRISDSKGEAVWDSSTMGHMTGDITMGENLFNELKMVYQAPILNEGNPVGTVWIGSASTIYRYQEKTFLLQVNIWIWISFIVIMIGVYGLSKRLSMQISRPLMQIKETATQMTNGNLEARVRMDDTQHEIHAVGDALNRLADTLLKQEKLRKTMTADIAHELRTPVTSVQSHIEAFQDGVWEPSPEKLDICHRQVMQLTGLIQDLEKLAEAENPMLQLQNEHVDLIAVIHESQRTVEDIGEKKRIQYIPPVQQELFIIGDYRRLLQIFTNLLSNAYKYTLENGMVKVSVVEESDFVAVRIQDTGVGIHANEMPYVFERFYRGEKSRNRKLGGAGIGLAVVKALVEAHRGHIYAESEVRTGSVFTVELPKR